MVHTLIIFEPIWPMLQNLSNAQMYMYLSFIYSLSCTCTWKCIQLIQPLCCPSLLQISHFQSLIPNHYYSYVYLSFHSYYSCTSCSCILFTFFLLFQSNFPPPIILPIPDLYYLVHVHVFIHPLYILSTIPIQSSTPNHPSYT